MDEVSHNDSDTRSVISTRKMEAIVAALLFLFGATFVYQSYELGFRWAIEGPQSGFFPFYVALIICGGSLVVFVNALRGRAGSDEQPFVERGQLKKVLSVLIPAAIFVLGVQLIGIYVAAAIYIAIGVSVNDFLLSFWVGVAYVVIAAWAVPTFIRRVL